jgi:ABC-type multidrug transport system fused ATPase/permease subunit
VADPGTPDFRSARHYLFWLASLQRGTIAGATIAATAWMLSQALLWAAVGGAVDHGIAGGHASQLWLWAGLILLLGIIQAVSGALRHQLAVTNWMRACYRTVQVVGRHITSTGTALTDEIPSGDIVNSVGADAPRIGMAFDSLARFIGAIISWLIVSFILLRSSHLLGLIVLIGVPTLALLTTPMMKPLHAAQAAQREATGRLAALGTDTVAGLRILRGIGGEDVFLSNYKSQSDLVRRAGVRAAVPQAALESGQLLLPAILTSVVTFIGAREVARGTLQPGQLVSFFGYATFLTTPLREVIQYSIMATRAYVGAGKVVRLLRVTPTVGETASPAPWPEGVDVFDDERSGVHVSRGQIAAVVTETPAESAALADRLGRFTSDVSGVRVNGVALEDFSLADTRRHVVVNDIEPRLCSGKLRYELVPHEVTADERILAALNAVSALDVLDALDDGLETRVDERGRSFSGGQRQRLSLARALLTNADVLILVEPTSAVDTHTEGRIAARLGEMRSQHATLVMSTSPLMLERMDLIYLVADGRVVAQGTHHELASTSSLYRQIVLREDS